jgi:hypothetical protein
LATEGGGGPKHEIPTGQAWEESKEYRLPVTTLVVIENEMQSVLEQLKDFCERDAANYRACVRGVLEVTATHCETNMFQLTGQHGESNVKAPECSLFAIYACETSWAQSTEFL